MKFGLYHTLAWRNLKANRRFQIPFILASSLMYACLYIMLSLTQNKYVIERHESLSSLMGMGSFITLILCSIFIIYGQAFISKRRSKEFSLYSILGFEKRHISMVVLVEQVINWLVIAGLSIISGQLLGTLLFKLLNNFLKDMSAGLENYPISWYSAGIVALAIGAVLTALYLWQSLRVSLLNPIELLSQNKSGEKHSKFDKLRLVIGVISLVAGYYIALTTKGLLESLSMFFVAVLLVMLGTYFLFMTLIAFVLRRMRAKKSHYYQAENFLSISGMLYRIRSNAVSLASIAILSTGFMLALGSTIAIYNGIEDTLNLSVIQDYNVNSDALQFNPSDVPQTIAKKRQQAQELLDKFKAIDGAKNFHLTENITIEGKLVKDSQKFVPLSEDERRSPDTFFMGNIMTIDHYNQLYGTDYQLADNELLINDLNETLETLDTIDIAGNTYQIQQNKDPLHTNIVIDYVMIVVPNKEIQYEIGQAFAVNSDYYSPGDFDLSFDVKDDSPEIMKQLQYILGDQPSSIHSRMEVRELTYRMNGGFLFLGIIIGLVLLIGTVLMIYYKQITEGYDDRHNYQIMKNVGLPDDLIRKTIRKQTFWLFALPIIVAVIHGLFAFKILFRLLGLFGIRHVMQFAIPYLIVIAVFVVIYYIIYLITSRVYYHIINDRDEAVY